MRALPWFSKVLVLAVLQGCLLFLAARFYDNHHRVAAGLVMMLLPLATGFTGRRRLGLSLQGCLVAYAVIPFLLAAYFRGIPALILKRGAVFFLVAIAPTALGWWAGGLSERLQVKTRR